MPSMMYEAWAFEAQQDTYATILPDGCRDVVLISGLGSPDAARFTEWDMRPRKVRIPAQTRILGYRLRPGVTVPWPTIRSVVEAADDPASVIADEARIDEEILLAIDLLTRSRATIRSVAAQLGVNQRTLQRRFAGLHLPSPDFWRLLGRARRAAKLLVSSVPIAEIAVDNGYSDQAHMTREFVRWFGLTPARLKRDTTISVELSQSGLGNWMGEHISIR